MKLQQALHIATDIVNKLTPHCNTIHIAGSIRREKQEVKDIEIVCYPKKTVLNDLFGWDEGTSTDIDFQYTATKLGTIIKGNTEGRYMQIALPDGINLDLFMPQDYDYYRQLAIRTGSAEFSHKVIATTWLALGWVGTDKGLRRREDCENISIGGGKYKWKIVNQNGLHPPVWKSEEEFFEWLTLNWIEPNKRK